MREKRVETRDRIRAEYCRWVRVGLPDTIQIMEAEDSRREVPHLTDLIGKHKEIIGARDKKEWYESL